MGQPYDTKADIYVVGLICHEIFAVVDSSDKLSSAYYAIKDGTYSEILTDRPEEVKKPNILTEINTNSIF